MNISAHISINELIDAKENISPLFALAIMATPAHRFDFSHDNPQWKTSDISKPEVLEHHIAESFKKNRRKWGFGGWGEHRHFYSQSERQGDEHIHLGLDIWLPEATEIYAPFTGIVHGFQDHAHTKGSGPTIITQHAIGDATFWILFGNLSQDSLEGIKVGKVVRSGDKIARIGAKHENGGWPPHVHLQIISDMTGHVGEFPQYVRQSEKERYLQICPNPESLIRPFLVT